MTVQREVMAVDQDSKPRLSVFSKMEKMIVAMAKADNENGIVMRAKRNLFSDQIQSFSGCDIVDWLKRQYNITDVKEACYLATNLCQYGYIYPIDFKLSSYTVKYDRSAEYRFQAPYFWPFRKDGTADSIKYAIYLQKRSLRNKQKHGLEPYEQEAFDKLLKVFADKKEFIEKQAREQVSEAKKQRRTEKILLDLQERAFWRVHRPRPGCIQTMEEGPKRYFQPSQMAARRRKNKDTYRAEIKFLKKALEKPKPKLSKVLESYLTWNEQYQEYDPFLDQNAALPSNPWISDDTLFWEANDTLVKIPTELRVKKWAISFFNLMKDEQGSHEFEVFLSTEYSQENIRFWKEVEDMKHGPRSMIEESVNRITSEFLSNNAPREINIDSKTLETVNRNKEEMKGKPESLRYIFDPAQEHIYLLMKKDSYPRFLRSDQYINLKEMAHNQPIKKRFFGFGSGKTQIKRQTPSPKLKRRSTSSEREANSDISGDSPIHSITPMHSYSTGNLKDMDMKQTPSSSSGLSPGQTRRRSDEPGRTRSMNAGDPRRKSNLEVPRSFPISTEKRKSDATLLSLNVPAKNNIVAPWEGNQ
ncbi:regulator of G-protein signaling 7-like isoform X7 [Crassostrea virginica]|uniref:Regulator of G-protein signaling 7-like isoform X8 n=1 Tax=Crassostrea virginica TaxID=6565 RepID=A0A8B8CFB1_CRAVI|nr:regulator of G-protein signaling 7-like isoform X8 [Crassostrea virginica]XP_022315288.1 regulator of G-protein signaling 7-like isoform X8 [Crassostrea virginica]